MVTFFGGLQCRISFKSYYMKVLELSNYRFDHSASSVYHTQCLQYRFPESCRGFFPPPTKPRIIFPDVLKLFQLVIRQKALVQLHFSLRINLLLTGMTEELSHMKLMATINWFLDLPMMCTTKDAEFAEQLGEYLYLHTSAFKTCVKSLQPTQVRQSLQLYSWG